MLRKQGPRNPCELEIITLVANKYQLALRTSNLPGRVYTGEMLTNEGGVRLSCYPYGISVVSSMDRMRCFELRDVGSIPARPAMLM